jgi:hypothetical protein
MWVELMVVMVVVMAVVGLQAVALVLGVMLRADLAVVPW